jgi:putative peptidoglycan lipid II flippase
MLEQNYLGEQMKLVDLWTKLTKGSVNNQIFGAAVTVAAGTAFVKAVAVVKELVVASQFGTGDAIDAFLIALIVPSFIINVISGALAAAFIPTYIKVREQQGKEASQILFSGVMLWTIGLLFLTIAVMLLGSPLYLPLIAVGFNTEKLKLTFHLFFIMAPLVAINGVAIVWGAVLNAGERFALVALLPIITPAITIVLLMFGQSLGIDVLALGLVIGATLECFVLGITLSKQGLPVCPKWQGFDANQKQVLSQYAPMMAGALLMCSTSIVDQSMAAMLPSGSVASLNYANRIISLPILIISTALGTAVIPYFSKLLAQEDWTSVRHTIRRYLGIVFAVSIPLTALVIFFSEPLVRILLQRDSFTAADTILVSQVQSYLALQIPFYLGCSLVVRLIAAMQRNHLMVWGSSLNLAINIGLNYLFMQWLGVAGIALSTSIVYCFSFLFLWFFANKLLNQQTAESQNI